MSIALGRPNMGALSPSGRARGTAGDGGTQNLSPATPAPSTDEGRRRADEEFARSRDAIYVRTDRLFAGLLAAEWVGAIVAALVVAPRTWAGLQSGTHPHVLLALWLGGVIVAAPIALALLMPGKAVTRHTVAVGQMLMSALLIHLTGGRIETHFHIFGSLAFLAFYRDWRVLITTAGVTAVDHVLRGAFLPRSVYGIAGVEPWRWVEHAGWVVFEVVFLSLAAHASVREMHGIAGRQAALEEAETAARRAGEEAHAAAARFESLSTASPVGVFEAAPGGAWRYANPRWSAVTGLGGEESLGEGWLRAVHPSERDEVARAWREAVAEGAEFSHEARVESRDGLLLWVKVQAVPLHDESGAVAGYVGTAEDVTERRQWAESLRRDKEMAEEANRAKSQFLANMSHELRTPLNSIIGFSEILSERTFGPLTPKQERYVGNIQNSGRHLLGLINDILDLSKIEAGRMAPEYETFSPVSALTDVQNIVRALAAKKSITLTADAPPSALPPVITADPSKFKQVLYNLLSNAIKFTPDGGRVTVRASSAPGVGGREMLEIAVSDTGIGIAPEDQQRIFGEFEQVDSSYSRQQQGTGLGLALTRRFVEMHGGAIRVESAGEGMGSTFLFSIPVLPEGEVVHREPAPEAAAPAPAAFAAAFEGIAAAAPAADGGEQPLVLVVDDDSGAAELLEHYLTGAGYRVERAASGDEVHGKARALKPAAITLDVMLPGKDGWEVLSGLKADPETAGIPVVIVSITPDRAMAEHLGAVECLVKPVDRERLIQTIQALRPDGDGAERTTVLVVDDDPRTLEMLSDTLNLRGFRVLTAEGGRRGAEAARQHRPDVIVLDLMMPEVSGFEVVRRLQADAATRGIPVIIYTANDISAEARRELDRHVVAVASKRGKADLIRELERVSANAAGTAGRN